MMCDVFVEGNIGSGKTTLINELNRLYKNITVCVEPIEKWRNFTNVNTLQHFYSNPRKWGFLFQNLVFQTVLNNHCKKLENKFMERSIYSCRYIFMEYYRKNGILSHIEYKILQEWFDLIVRNVEIKGKFIVYLRTDPMVAMNRIQARNRTEEKSITFKFIHDLHKLHENWLIHKNFEIPFPVIILNGNDEDIGNIVSELITQISTSQFHLQLSLEK